MCILILDVLISIYETTENGTMCPKEKYVSTEYLNINKKAF